MLSEITISNKTITLQNSKELINNNNTREFIQHTITMSEYNINSILGCDDEHTTNSFIKYQPKKVFTDLIPFLVEIIKNDVVIKSVYCFGLYQNDIFENPHNEQVMNKDIEIIVDFETPEDNIKQLLLNNINDMRDHHYYIDDDLNNLTLTVVKVELFREFKDFKEERIYNTQTYKEDKCIICLETKPNILFCDCGHLVLCDECFNKLVENKCPKCRTNNKIIRKI